MENKVQKIIEQYVDAHTDGISQVLQELAQETEKITGRLRWSVGKVEGKLLQLLIKISNAKRVVEVGTFTGFSALIMAEALPEDGRVLTCETHKEYADIARRYFKKSPHGIARRYFKKSPHGQKIQLKFGPAAETLKSLPDTSVDFVFIDADKPSYGQYFDEALRMLRSGGLIFVDNVFWRNKVFKRNISNENAKAIAAFNQKVKNNDRTEKVMLSVRDGIYLIRKK
jgi:caffeoyl-CoA O-methyltransferase